MKKNLQTSMSDFLGKFGTDWKVSGVPGGSLEDCGHKPNNSNDVEHAKPKIQKYGVMVLEPREGTFREVGLVRLVRHL
jgi:hypothetical protein